jgi:hypothetical protein
VHDITTCDAVSCQTDMDLASAARIMLKGRVGTLPVVDSRRCVTGMLTDRDAWPARVTAPDTLVEAGAAAGRAELEREAMCARLLPFVRDAAARRIMRRIQAQSHRRHMPAFRRCFTRGLKRIITRGHPRVPPLPDRGPPDRGFGRRAAISVRPHGKGMGPGMMGRSHDAVAMEEMGDRTHS